MAVNADMVESPPPHDNRCSAADYLQLMWTVT